jgi:hypothetical protein
MLRFFFWGGGVKVKGRHVVHIHGGIAQQERPPACSGKLNEERGIAAPQEE